MHGPWGALPTVAALGAAGGGDVTFACSVAGQGSVAVAIREERKLVAAVAGLAAIADSLTVAGTALLACAVTGQAAIAAALKEDKRLAALVAGGAQVTVGARLERLLQNVVSGQATVLAAIDVELGGGGGPLLVKDVDQTVHIVSTWR